MAALRVLLLFGLLTAIFLAVGLFFAGTAGLTFGLTFAFVTNFFAYWFSDKLVLRMYGAKKFSDKKISSMVDKLAKKASIPKPELYVMNSAAPNAFATGRDPNHSSVAVTKGLIERLDDDEIEGVLAHELNHIKHRDTLISTLAATVAGAITWLGYMFWFSDNDNRNIVSYIFLFILAPFAAMLVQLSISRGREYLADRGAAEISSPNSLADALEKISTDAKQRPMRGNNATAHMFIVNPFTAGSVMSLFSTHPPIEERINRLRQMR
ncbi:MAG: zinc metalloprotease HtpX [Candidatus Aenigmatarchaeota archaeon]